MKFSLSCLTFIKRVRYVTTDNRLNNGTRFAKKYRVLQLKNITTEMQVFSVHWKTLYQSTKGWPCPDRSRCNNVVISVETDFEFLTPEMKFLCSKTSNLGFSAVFLT